MQLPLHSLQLLRESPHETDCRQHAHDCLTSSPQQHGPASVACRDQPALEHLPALNPGILASEQHHDTTSWCSSGPCLSLSLPLHLSLCSPPPPLCPMYAADRGAGLPTCGIGTARLGAAGEAWLGHRAEQGAALLAHREHAIVCQPNTPSASLPRARHGCQWTGASARLPGSRECSRGGWPDVLWSWRFAMTGSAGCRPQLRFCSMPGTVTLCGDALSTRCRSDHVPQRGPLVRALNVRLRHLSRCAGGRAGGRQRRAPAEHPAPSLRSECRRPACGP